MFVAQTGPTTLGFAWHSFHLVVVSKTPLWHIQASSIWKLQIQSYGEKALYFWSVSSHSHWIYFCHHLKRASRLTAQRARKEYMTREFQFPSFQLFSILRWESTRWITSLNAFWISPVGKRHSFLTLKKECLLVARGFLRPVPGCF